MWCNELFLYIHVIVTWLIFSCKFYISIIYCILHVIFLHDSFTSKSEFSIGFGFHIWFLHCLLSHMICTTFFTMLHFILHFHMWFLSYDLLYFLIWFYTRSFIVRCDFHIIHLIPHLLSPMINLFSHVIFDSLIVPLFMWFIYLLMCDHLLQFMSHMFTWVHM